MKIKYVVADKGYDSKANRRYALQKKAYPHIPYKKFSGVGYERAGVPLKFDEKIYHQRSKAETVFSVIKWKYGSIVKGKNFISQEKEIILMLVTYNLDREIKLSSLLVIGFQQSN